MNKDRSSELVVSEGDAVKISTSTVGDEVVKSSKSSKIIATGEGR